VFSLNIKKKKKMSQLPSYKIHCFGDSLTEGYSWANDRLIFAPYTRHLKDFFDSLVEDEDECEFKKKKFEIGSVLNHGKSGHLTAEIRGVFNEVKDLEKRILQKRDSQEIFVFLGGTNDLGTRHTPDEAFSNMYPIIFDCVNNGNKVVVCSIPSTASVLNGSKSPLHRARLEYNGKLETLSRELGPEVCQFVDLYKITGRVVYEDDEDEDDDNEKQEEEEVDKKRQRSSFVEMRLDVAADNLHFNVDGYRLMAQHIARALQKFF
jgi:lysophospholipase L1-like esterase